MDQQSGNARRAPESGEPSSRELAQALEESRPWPAPWMLGDEKLQRRAPLKLGEVIDRKYEVRGVLGCGGQSWVFYVAHLFLGEHYALKLIHRDDGLSPETFLRALAEARIQRTLGHENIARIEDAGLTDQGQFYLVMELMPGRSLRSVLAEHRTLEVNEALSIALQIAQGMSAVHQKNIIHRDLKPENLFLNPGNSVKIIDFGVAKMLEKPHFVTRRDLVLGTVQYMSPEQFQARPLTPLSDIYALGVILYELILGQGLVDYLLQQQGLNRDLYGMGSVILKTPTPLLHEIPGLERKVPPYFSAFVNQCVAKLDSQRFQSMEAVERAVRACLRRMEKELPPQPVRELWHPLTASADVSAVRGASVQPAQGPKPEASKRFHAVPSSTPSGDRGRLAASSSGARDRHVHDADTDVDVPGVDGPWGNTNTAARTKPRRRARRHRAGVKTWVAAGLAAFCLGAVAAAFLASRDERGPQGAASRDELAPHGAAPPLIAPQPGSSVLPQRSSTAKRGSHAPSLAPEPAPGAPSGAASGTSANTLADPAVPGESAAAGASAPAKPARPVTKRFAGSARSAMQPAGSIQSTTARSGSPQSTTARSGSVQPATARSGSAQAGATAHPARAEVGASAAAGVREEDVERMRARVRRIEAELEGSGGAPKTRPQASRKPTKLFFPPD